MLKELYTSISTLAQKSAGPDIRYPARKTRSGRTLLKSLIFYYKLVIQEGQAGENYKKNFPSTSNWWRAREIGDVKM